jgi:hypothetical protein
VCEGGPETVILCGDMKRLTAWIHYSWTGRGMIMFVADEACDWSLAAAVARCGDGAVRSSSQWCWGRLEQRQACIECVGGDGWRHWLCYYLIPMLNIACLVYILTHTVIELATRLRRAVVGESV